MSKGRLRSGLLRFLGASCMLSPVFAAPITYTLTGYMQTTGSGRQFNGPFTWTVSANTQSITSPAAGRFQVSAESSSIVLSGLANLNLSGVSVQLNTNTGAVSFGNTSTGFVMLSNNQLRTWDFASPIGPLNGANTLLGGSQSTTLTATDGTVINILGVTTGSGPNPAFQATTPPPAISSVVNAASGISQALPNGAIAPGSIFLVLGSSMGPAAISIAPSIFQNTSVSGTSVAVTAGGVRVNALMYYTSEGQVAALLPSNTPTGAGVVTVSFGGQTSATFPITVVANNVGIFTLSSNGQGVGIVTYPDYSLVSPAKSVNCGGPGTNCGAANPGDTLTIWATGLGPVAGSDAAGAGLGQDMPNLPIKVWLGGVQAPVVYRGRSGCCVGEDQVVFTVPNTVPTGCAVPLFMQIGNLISNNTVMAVANGSRSCTPSNPAFTAVNLQQAVNAGPIAYGQIKLTRDLNPSGAGSIDNAKFQFLKLGYAPGSQPFLASYVDDPPLGTCLVSNALNPASTLPLISVTNADAGSHFTIAGPNGPQVVSGIPGGFSVTLSASGTYLDSGDYSVKGTGGSDVGAFSAAVTIPILPVLTSPPVTAFNVFVTRSNGLTVTWNKGGASGNVLIQVSGATDNANTTGATVTCQVAASSGTFTIPSFAMLALPAGPFGGFQFSSQAAASPIAASGLSLGLLETNTTGVSQGLTLQ